MARLPEFVETAAMVLGQPDDVHPRSRHFFWTLSNNFAIFSDGITFSMQRKGSPNNMWIGLNSHDCPWWLDGINYRFTPMRHDELEIWLAHILFRHATNLAQNSFFSGTV